jgi:quercetin dioxygenase-like cupin family protein
VQQGITTERTASPSAGARADWGPGVGLVWETTVSSAERVEGIQHFAPRMAGPPVHTHPSASESFHVLEGEIEVQVDGDWRTVAPGETATVPPGVPHAVRNRSDAPAKVVNAHWPGQRMEQFFLDGGRLASEGKIKALPPKDPTSAIYAAMLFRKYPDELRVTGPKGPLFRVLAAIGRLRGFRV